jgi:hypothetical protein
LVAARWADPAQSAGRHQIFVEVLDDEGRRAVTEVVIVAWPGGSVQLPVKTDPLEPWGWVFDMYNTLGSYDAYVGGAVPSDRVTGMGLGTIEYPNIKFHTSFYLTYNWVP